MEAFEDYLRSSLPLGIERVGYRHPAPPSEPGKPRASSIGSGCLRQIWYGLNGETHTNPDSEVSGYRQQEGQTLEGQAKAWILACDGIREVEWPEAPADLPWTATPDIFVSWHETLYVVEIKFMGYLRFKDLITVQDIFTVHAPYYWQMQAQMERMGCNRGLLAAFPFDYGAVKGSMRGKPAPPFYYIEEVERSEHSIAALTKVAGATTNPNLMPPRGYQPNNVGEKPKHWQCEYCSWLDKCREDGA